ncbi:MAG: PASTA domain-containing protein [Candidatus Sumerlaeota bacterium]|nr:PASTA domain-containing protein [Candidatus Sumerlaeota bacterium]
MARQPTTTPELSEDGRSDRAPDEEPSHWLFSPLGCLLGIVGAVFRLIWLVVLTFFVMGLAGAGGYWAVRHYVTGKVTTVPLIVDMDAYDAAVLLGKAGLYMELQGDPEVSDTKPAGFVLDQHPEPETKVKTGTPVQVKLSSGPTMVDMPDLRGKDYKEAEVLLDAADLKAGRYSKIESRSVALGGVVTTDPPPQAKVRRGAAVNLLISSGPPRFEISMPRLTGKTRAQAAAALQRLGLKIDEVRQQVQPNAPAGVIVDQSPAAGVRLDPLNSIIVTISAGSG